MKFADFVKGKANEETEKHVPHIKVKKCDSCPDPQITVSVVKHPNMVKHHISWLQLYGLKEEGPIVHLMTTDLVPELTDACAHICIKKGEFKKLLALSYCNLHGVWENSVDL